MNALPTALFSVLFTLAPLIAQAQTTVCPTTTATNTDCAFIITIGPGGVITGAAVPNANPYDSVPPYGDDALVGVVNNSGAPYTGSFTLTSSSAIFGFDGDGICYYIQYSAAGAYCSGAYYQTTAGQYAGPLTTFSNISDDATSGTITITGLAAGASTFFSLEGSPSQIASGGGSGGSGGLGGLPVTPSGPAGGPVTVTGNSNLGTIPLGASLSSGLSVSGGVPPYTATVIGAVPPGVTVSGAGISGTPTQPGNYTVGISVADSTGSGQTLTYSFSVFGFTTSTLPQGVVGAPYYGSVPVLGGTAPYSFTVTGLPPGLSGNSSGGISGIVNSAVTAQVKVTATESGSGVSVSGTLTLVFAAPAPLTVPATTLPAGAISTTYSQALTANGGAPPYTFTLYSGSLPQGLSLHTGGTVTGIPAQSGSFSFSVRASDYTGASAVGSVSLTVSPAPLTLIPASGALAGAVAGFEFPGQTLGASGGTGPYTFAVTSGSLPAGLSLSTGGTLSGTPTGPGTASFTVTAKDSTGATATAQYSIPVRPASTDLLLSSGSLSFSLIAGSAALPAAQQVAVQSTSVTTLIGYSVTISPSSATWLSVTPAAGTTPGTFSVGLTSQASALAAATTPYAATIAVACLSPAPCAGFSQQVSVSLTVAGAPPVLSISSSLLSFTTAASAPQSSSQSLTLQNTGGGSIGISSVTCAASFCSVSGTPGSISAGMSASLNVNVNPAGLNGGFYRTTITITSSAGVYIVPVTLFIAAAGSLSLEPAGAQYQVSPGGIPNGADPHFTINVNSVTPVPYTITATVNGNLFTFSSTTGMVSASQPAIISYAFSQAQLATLIGAVSGLTPQAYYATIQVSSPGLVNSPQTFEVVLNVLPPSVPQRPAPQPGGLLFITTAASAPPPQNITISTASAAALQFQVSAATLTGGNWLAATPSVGTAQPGSPAVTQVSVNPSSLQPGVYSGGVNFAFGNAGVRTVNVTLLVTAASATGHDTPEPALVSKATSCTPSQLVPVQTQLLGNFAAAVAWPTPLSVQLVDDCGNPVTNGQIVASFTNGDPPVILALSNPATATYVGTWTPHNSSAQVTVNARVSSPTLPTVTAKIAGSVTPNAAPLLNAGSELHLFNPQPGAALAPGTLATVSGSGLSVTNASAPAGAPLPTTLNGTQVIVGGTAVPLQSVSPTLLTVEMPFELMSGMQYQILVSANGAFTTPDQIQLSNTSPGVSTSTGGLLTAYHGNGNAVTEAAPAAPGESIYLLGAGLGATDTPVADGAISPSMPPANALDQPTITINNEPAVISFAGLQPGAIGIYQVTFTVPSDAASGDLNLVLTQDGVPANTAVLPVKQGP